MSYGQYSPNSVGRIAHDVPRQARVRQVVDTDTVAHLWAHQTQEHARNKLGNFYFHGPIIYSYGSHFAIARIMVAPSGQTVVLFNTAGYSVTTAKQNGIVRRACRHMPTFEVDSVTGDSAGDRAINYEHMVRKASECAAKAKRARTNADWHLRSMNDWLGQANGYSDAFELGQAPLTAESLGVAVADLEARIAAERARQEAEHRAQERIRAQENRDRLRAWLRGDDITPPRTMRPMVRVMGNTVETTWGASVPLVDALRAYQAAKLAHSGAAISARLDQVGSYGAASIDSRGNIRVGCHTIPFRFAKVAACLAGIDHN